MAAEPSTVAGMVDAQLTVVKILKPFPNFENVYQGQSALAPIVFPGVVDRLAETGTAGIDPALMAGIPVPQGSRVLLQFPMCFTPDGAEDPFQLYSYRLVWRASSLGRYTTPARGKKRAPWHYPRSSVSAADTSSGSSEPRIPIPASWHSIGYQTTEPLTGLSGALNIHVEEITPRLNATQQFEQPYLPNGSRGVIQQGIADPSFIASSLMPIYVPFWTDAEGDELLILVNRTGAAAEDVWDFTDETLDLAFSNTYGNGNGTHPVFKDLGIQMQTGTTP